MISIDPELLSYYLEIWRKEDNMLKPIIHEKKFWKKLILELLFACVPVIYFIKIDTNKKEKVEK